MVFRKKLSYSLCIALGMLLLLPAPATAQTDSTIMEDLQQQETIESLELEPWDEQESSAESDYFEKPINTHEIDEAKWQESTEGLQYNEKPKPKKEEKEPKEFRQWKGLNLGGNFLQILLIAAGVVLIAFLVYYIIKSRIIVAPKKVKDKTPITLEEAEENLPESELERFLREALVNNDYRLAIRVYYLMVIKELSLKGLVNWRKDKTNYEYILEMAGKQNQPAFRNLTGIFERVWYGDRMISQEDYMMISPEFEQYVNSVKVSAR